MGECEVIFNLRFSFLFPHTTVLEKLAFRVRSKEKFGARCLLSQKKGELRCIFSRSNNGVPGLLSNSNVGPRGLLWISDKKYPRTTYSLLSTKLLIGIFPYLPQFNTRWNYMYMMRSLSIITFGMIITELYLYKSLTIHWILFLNLIYFARNSTFHLNSFLINELIPFNGNFQWSC